MVTVRRRARSALPVLAALCALTSCGIPTTGVVQAGGPASGVVPMTRVYFLRGDTLIGVRRETAVPGDIESALRELVLGPTEVERGTGLTTRLPLLTGLPTPVPAVPATDGGPVAAPEATDATDLLTVTARDHRISVELSASAGELTDPGLAVAQIVCTADAAQRVAAPGYAPDPVTVTAPNGRPIRGASARCPES
ncbi:hypothetical protein [Streptomyces sp. NPDC048277]|uniref:hypothetical protein n=1 Tax=Streptomyces sp. NPDC048277 TaxID=3155027 RepID=UPI0033D76BE1